MDTLTLRALTAADVPALTALLAAAEKVDQTGEHYSAEDIADELADETLDLARDTLGAVTPDGRLVGFASVRGSATVRDVDRVYWDGAVLPSRRGEGIGTRMLEWAGARATELHRSRHPAVPGVLSVSVPGTVPGFEDLVRTSGFEPIRWWYTMRRGLDDLPPVPAGPDGLTLVPYHPRYDEALRIAHGEAFADHWGSVPPDPQRWAHWFTGSNTFRPTISFLVLDGTEVAAYLLAYFFDATLEATGVREAYIGQVGTLRAYRRRGLGAVLLATALTRFRAEGYQSAELTVDTSNPTGALGLYERAGFGVDRRAVTWTRAVE